MKKIPYGKHFIDDNDINAVTRILKSPNLTQGPEIEKFEKTISEYVGAKYAVAVSSCTAGLHLSTIVGKETDNTSFYTSPITFVASPNAAIYSGLKPTFIDVEDSSINMDISILSEHLSSDTSERKIIMPVHFAGLPCDMKSIHKLKKYNTFVIEDAAHALGARYECGSMVGSCKYSDLTVFSFHPVKNIATGEGGVITTNNLEFYKKLLRLRSHGITKLNDKFINHKLAESDGITNPWYYEMQEIGYHYRITDIQAALGNSQIKKINLFLNHRKKLVDRYFEKLATCKPYITPMQINNDLSANHLFVVSINFNEISISRAELMMGLQDKGIFTQVHYMPVNLQPFYQDLGYSINDTPVAASYYEKALSLPLYYPLSDEDQDYVINSLLNLIL